MGQVKVLTVENVEFSASKRKGTYSNGNLPKQQETIYRL